LLELADVLTPSECLRFALTEVSENQTLPAVHSVGDLFGEESKRSELMARFAHFIAVGIPHHITQRGNAWSFILQDEADRKV
jgi:hypothetical protein